MPQLTVMEAISRCGVDHGFIGGRALPTSRDQRDDAFPAALDLVGNSAGAVPELRGPALPRQQVDNSNFTSPSPALLQSTTPFEILPILLQLTDLISIPPTAATVSSKPSKCLLLDQNTVSDLELAIYFSGLSLMLHQIGV